MLAILRAHYPEIAAFGVTSLALFGSFARDEAGPGLQHGRSCSLCGTPFS